MNAEYTYLGDRHTDQALIGQRCAAVHRTDGKCIRGVNGSMLVRFQCGRLATVNARRLRKIAVKQTMNWGGHPAKRVMRNPERFIGKRINGLIWSEPDGYCRCAITGKFHRQDDAMISCYVRHFIDRKVLSANGIYVEEADWLSQEGYDIVLSTIERLGLSDQYNEAMEDLFP